MIKLWFLLFVLLLTFSTSQALQSYTGVVVDDRGRPISGVNIAVEGAASGVVTAEDGSFTLNVDPTTSRNLTFTHIGYQPVMTRLTEGKPLRVRMASAILSAQGITVSGDRATLGTTPIAFTDFTSKELKRDYMLGEFPLLIETMPNVYAYADAGGGLGYSYLKIRGFDDKRVSVYINGVPLNDPEDQATYFVDMPDFAANVKDIQVQRGIGNSLYGDASFGGSVNIVSAGLEQERRITLTSGYGSFWHDGKTIGSMQKQSVEYQSGLIDGRWNLAGRYSRQLSDGYRRDSWYNGWAYYLSVSRLDPKVTTVFNLYGGPMQMHLAYWGISGDQVAQDRRFNPLTYENETDNFNQPHYELHNTIKLDERLTLRNTMYHIHGNGYYEQYKEDRIFSDYNIPPTYLTGVGGDTVNVITHGDLVRQQWVNKNQWGWSPRLEMDHSHGTAAVGGSFYYFKSEHWGQVVWAEGITNEVDPRHRYYEYSGTKYFGSLYGEQNYRLNERLSLMTNLQLRYQTYDFDQNKMGAFQGFNYNVSWPFVSPRVGLNYSLNSKISLLFNYSLSSRAPADYEIYNAGDPSAMPSLRVKSVKVISAHDSTIVFGDPTAKAERVHDFELGLNYRDSRQSHSINLYWMEFQSEIVQNGGINLDLGLPITTNVDRSLHAGIELASARNLGSNFKVSGNLSYAYNKIKEFKISEPVYDNPENYAFVGYQTFDYHDMTIAGFPEYIGNFIGEYSNDRFHLTYRGRLIGRMYVENNNRRDLSIDPFFTSSLSAAVSIGGLLDIGDLALSARIDNVFNRKYAASGYGGAERFRDGADQFWAEYIPAAERSFFATLKLELR
jgi:iron complex outermembrane receptor protein